MLGSFCSSASLASSAKPRIFAHASTNWINARPTIVVSEGERGTVILTKGLQLPAYRP